MKTERFDEEFRRKLLGLPTETDAGDVERIFGYVSANRPVKPGIGWGKGLLYGTAAAVLIGSLGINLNQYHTNKHLYSSLDSLQKHQSLTQTAVSKSERNSVTAKTTLPHPSDTLYITRYRDRSGTLPQHGVEANGSVAGVDAVAADIPAKPVPAPIDRNTDVTRVNTPTTPPNQESDRAVPEPSGSPRSTEKQRPGSAEPAPAGLASGMVTPVEGIESNEAGRPSGRATAFGKFLTKTRSATRQRSDEVTVRSLPNGQSAARPMEVSAASVNDASNTALLTELLTRTTIDANFLQSRPLPAYIVRSQVIRPVVAYPVASGVPVKHHFQLALPHVAVAGTSFWAGAGVGAGHEQLGSSLVGEWRLNSHWSVQTGVQLAFQGNHFFSEDDFTERTRQDFRTLYASAIPNSYELLDINQTYQLVQIPLTVAYHYPLGHNWSLRFGLGTNLNLQARNRFTYDYRDNSRSSDHGFYRAFVPVNVVNNMMLSAGIERQWKGWLFRASPFISPQLKSLDHNHEKAFWGAQFQVLHRFGGR